MAEILRRCGNELTRADVPERATTLAGFPLAVLPDGVDFRLHRQSYTPMKTLYISVFNRRGLGTSAGQDP